MAYRKEPPLDAAQLRKLAEEVTQERSPLSGEDLSALSHREVQAIVHELRVHQVELEMQNDELQRLHHDLQEALERYVSLYDFAPVGYLTMSESGVVQRANLTAAHLLQIERSSLMGQPFTDFIVPEDQDVYYLHRKELFATRKRQVCELRLKKSDTSTLWARLDANIEDQISDEARCRVIISDVTERKRADVERARLLAQLAQAQKLEAIGTLAGGVAHDFNNILSGILGGLSLLDYGDASDESTFRQDIDEMKLLVQRAANLTRQLLGFARCGHYDVRPLNVATIADRTIQLFGRTRKDIALVVDVSATTEAVLIDHTQLEQVLLNLFINAGQAMPLGGTLSLQVRPAEVSPAEAERHGIEPGRFVALQITDTGVGMDSATQARIFEPFFTTKSRGEGTGLGLAAVHGIVSSHGGMVNVISEPGRGSTFTIYLPVTERPADAETTITETVKPGSGTILLVDDEAPILSLNARLLARVGYNVLTASSGKLALDLIEKHRGEIVLVILDLIMPELSGRQTYEAIRTLEPSLKVLLASGYSVEGEAQELLDQGCCGFIQKPFSIAELSAKLRELL